LHNIPNNKSLLDADDAGRSLAEVDRDSGGVVDAPDSEVDGTASSTLGVELTDLSVGSGQTRASSDGLVAEFTAEITGGRMLSKTIVLSANAFLRCGRVS
jgi:hypothetical protein